MSILSKKDYPGKQDNVQCGECGGKMILRMSKYGPFYGCKNYPDCRGTHGAHPDGSPLGIPADEETKKWRMKCHKVFDQLWKDSKYGMNRQDAYSILQAVTGLSPEDAHIGRFDIETCKKAINKIEKYYLK